MKNPFISVKTASPTTQSDEEFGDSRGSPAEPKVGELSPGEAEDGGLGRHLGVFSTTALM